MESPDLSSGMPFSRLRTILFRAVLIFSLFLNSFYWVGVAPRQTSAAAPSLNVTLVTPYAALDSNNACNAGPRGMFIEMLITNSSGSVITGLSATISAFSNISFTLGTSETNYRYVGTIAAGASVPVYYYVVYPCTPIPSSTNFTLSVSNSGGTYTSGTMTLTTRSELSANAGGDVAAATLGNGAVVGQVITMSVNYSFGNPSNKNADVNIQPAGNSDFYAGCFQLTGVDIVSSTFSAGPITSNDNRLYFTNVTAGTSSNTLTAVYYFLYTCNGIVTTAKPFADLDAGGVKYTGNYQTLAVMNFPAATKPFVITETVNPIYLDTTGSRIVTYTVTISNPSSYATKIDEIDVTLPPGATFNSIASGSGVTAANSSSVPSAGVTGTVKFVGKYNTTCTNGVCDGTYQIAAGGTVTLMYVVNIPATKDTYTDSVRALIGTTSVGPASTSVYVGSKPPASIAVNSGNAQSTRVMTNFTNPLVVVVKDDSSTVVSDTVVTFFAPASGASGTAISATVTTDANGLASTYFTANSIVGSYVVTATYPNATTPAVFNLTNTPGAPYSITLDDSSSPQSTLVSTNFANPLKLVVKDAYGNLVPGTTVTYTVVPAGNGASGTPATITATTDISGSASITFTANATVGSYTVSATVAGVATPGVFELSNVSAIPTSITADPATTPQSTPVTTQFPQPLKVVVRDASNNPISNVQVVYEVITATNGASGTAVDNTVTTDINGTAVLTYTANTVAGSYTVSATVSGLSTPAIFNLTNTPGAPSTLTGDPLSSPQTTVVNTNFYYPLKVTVKDAYGNVISGTAVTFAPTPAGNGASGTPISTTVNTNSSGEASITFTANKIAGSYVVSASVSGVAIPAVFNLTNIPAAAATITADAGATTQSTIVTTDFGKQLKVEVKDTYGNVISGTTVTYQVITATNGASGTPATINATTDISGTAAITFTANTVAGSYTVSATVAGVATPAIFNLTNTPGSPASVTADPVAATQSTIVNTDFAKQLKVTVTDAYSNVISGTSVTYTVIPATGGASGIPATVTASTNISGSTGITFTANTIVGSYTVSATVAGVTSPAIFNLTNTPGNPASITADPDAASQSTEVTTKFTHDLKVVVKDANGNLVPGKTITYTAIPALNGASGTPITATATTDTNGEAVITFTANTITGNYNVFAAVAGVGTPAIFNLTNTPGAPASVTADPIAATQSTIVNTDFAKQLKVTVTDAYSNVISGTSVTYTVIPATGGASGTPATINATTNISGTAAITFTANTVAGSYTVSATVAGVATPAIFNLTNTPASPASITADPGAITQSTQVTTQFAKDLKVVVTDIYSNVISGTTVSYTVIPAGNGASGSSASYSATTGAGGDASISFTANGVAGSYTVSATVSGVATPAVFSLTNTPGAAANITADPDAASQSTLVNTDFSKLLKVEVKDATGNLLTGVTVTYTVIPAIGGASGTPAIITATTDINGSASITFKANTIAGSYTVSATVAGVTTPAIFNLTNTPSSPASITADPTTATQSTTINTDFAKQLKVTVTDAYSNVISGTTVTYTVIPAISGASGTPAIITATTGINGSASITFTANSVAGSYTVSATVAGVATPAVFNLTNTPGSPASVTTVSGTDTQSAIVTTQFAKDLKVVVRDASNNLLTGVTVTYTVYPALSGASGTPVTATATTNASGEASLTFTANGTVGVYQVKATVSGVVTAAVFDLTNLPGDPANITADSLAATQSTTVNTDFAKQLKVTVTDAYSNVVPGVTVTYTVNPAIGGASGMPAIITATTDINGSAAITFTANVVAGSYTVSTTVAGISTPAVFNLTNLPGAPASITADPTAVTQSTEVTTRFTYDLKVVVTDANGNLVPDAIITYTAFPALNGASGTPITATATTNASGEASIPFTANAIAGSYKVYAAVAGVGTPAIFNLTNLPGAPASVTADPTTDNQSTVVNTDFAKQLKVVVRDTSNNLLSGVTVTYTVIPAIGGASGTPATITATTDINGSASITFTANTVAGSYTVSTTVAGISTPAVFNLTNTPASPANITADPLAATQSTTINTDFAKQLKVTVTDAYSNVISGTTVTYTVIPAIGGASGTPGTSTATTDINGSAAITFTANAVAGSYTVSATVSGVATPAVFNLTNLPGAPASVMADTAAATQNTEVTTKFAKDLLVVVKDANNNLLTGVTVTYTVVPAVNGASGSATSYTVTTNASGEASITFTANGVAGSYTVSATVAGVATPAVFSLTNDPGPVSGITADTAAANQSTIVTTDFSKQLKVVVKDANDNVLSNVTVTYTAIAAANTASGTPAIITATTDINGSAAITFTANTVAGSYTVSATVAGVATPAIFNLTNTPGNPASVTTSDQNSATQSTLISTNFSYPLKVVVKDVYNNVVSGTTVTYTVNPALGGASGTPATTTATTNASGEASITFTANAVAGSYTVSATVSGVVTAAVFNLTNTPGSANSITADPDAISQSTLVTKDFAKPLKVVVKDASNNLLSNVTVTYQVTAAQNGASGSATNYTATTDSNGAASITFTANSIAGSYQVTASVSAVAGSPAPSGKQTNGAPGGTIQAVFSLTNLPDVPASITADTGAATQSARVTTDFTKPLKVVVRDAYNNLVSAVTVTYTVNPAQNGASGSSINYIVTTDINGSASITFTANTIVGSYVVSASLTGGVLQASFNLSNIPGSASIVTADADTTPQSTLVNTNFPKQLAVVVKDANSNLIPGVTVTFSVVPANGAGGSFASNSTATANTGANGIATSPTIKANNIAGNFTVTAEVAEGSAPATFNLTNLPNTAESITVDPLSTPQNTLVNSAFNNPLTVVVRDANGNPKPGAVVTFVIIPSNGAGATFGGPLTFTVTTGDNGVATAPAPTANGTVGSYTVQVSSAGGAAPVVLNLSNTAAPAPVATAVNGNGQQSTAINTTFANPLQLTFKDASGNPLAGRIVTFTIYSQNGAGATFDGKTTVTVTTDANGVATTPPVLANNVAGKYRVVAVAQGAANPVYFLLNNIIKDPIPADLGGQLRVSPDRVLVNQAGNQLTFTIYIKNLEKGLATLPYVLFPIDPSLEVVNASFPDKRDWVNQLVTGGANPHLEMRFHNLNKDEQATATVTFALKPGVAAGKVITFRYQVLWDDETAVARTHLSNSIKVVVGDNKLDDSLGKVQPFVVDHTTVVKGGAVHLSADFFAPDEKVDLWYTTANNQSVSLGYRWADKAGRISFDFQTADLAPDVYSISGRGDHSGFRIADSTMVAGNAAVTVSGGLQSLTASKNEASSGDVINLTGNFFSPGERVDLWYTDEAGKSVPLGYVWADEHGSINFDWNTVKVKPGKYAVIARGTRSEITALVHIGLK